MTRQRAASWWTQTGKCRRRSINGQRSTRKQLEAVVRRVLYALRWSRCGSSWDVCTLAARSCASGMALIDGREVIKGMAQPPPNRPNQPNEPSKKRPRRCREHPGART
jgi:hypothetical protein